MFQLTLEEYQEKVASLLADFVAGVQKHTETLDVNSAVAMGRVLAEPVYAEANSPLFDNSQMDGYAVYADDLLQASEKTPVSLSLGPVTAAGDTPRQHSRREASPVMTGAAIPAGANAIVPVEKTLAGVFPKLFKTANAGSDAGFNAGQSVEFTEAVTAGSFIRRAGEDIREGEELMPAGTKLTPARLGALALSGVQKINVLDRPRVLLCSTGDELKSVPGPGQIFDANTPMLRAALREAGCEVVTVLLPDDPLLFRDLVFEKAADADLIVTTGGISKGAFEVVRLALEPEEVEFGSVFLQPGGPQGLGKIASAGMETPVLCFPGNPVSALLSFELFLNPWLRELRGLPRSRAELQATLVEDVYSPAKKHQVRRAELMSDGAVRVFAPGSHLLSDLAQANALLHIPYGVSKLEAGSKVKLWRFNE